MKAVIAILGSILFIASSARAASICMIDMANSTFTVVCDGQIKESVAVGAYPDILVQATVLQQKYVANGYHVVGFTNDQGITIILEK